MPTAVLPEHLYLAASILELERAQAAVAPDYSADPVGWIQGQLGASLWSKQKAIVEAVRDTRRVAVPSAHSCGKSFVAARLMAWWIATRPPGEAFVVTTAPSFPLVRAVLWREARRAHSQGHLPGSMNQTEWWVNNELVAFGRKPDDTEPTGLQGIHARHVLVIIDEAAGVAEPIFRAAASLASNEHSRLLAIGNPTDPESYFATICKPDSGWLVIPVDGRESPNFTPEGAALPDELRDLLLSPVYAQELRDELGESSPDYVSRICGQFPDTREDALFRLAWLHAARDRAPAEVGDWEAGIDVAGPGEDETVLCIRQGPTLQHIQAFHSPDPRGDVLAALAPYRGRVACVKVDTVGQGYYFARHLEDHGWRGAVVDVNVGESATSDDAKEKYANLKAELYWGLRLRAEAGDLAGLTDALTLSQLAGIRYSHNPRGQVAIERKEDARKRGVKSPDRAEAVMLAFAPLGVPRAGVWFA